MLVLYILQFIRRVSQRLACGVSKENHPRCSAAGESFYTPFFCAGLIANFFCVQSFVAYFLKLSCLLQLIMYFCPYCIIMHIGIQL